MTQDKAHPTPPAVPSDDQWQMPKEPSLFAFINSNPILQSLLYDIDLLPEQIREHRNWFRMVVIVEHFRLALAAPVASNTTAEPAPVQPAGVEVERDAARLDWVERNLFERKWGGNIGQPSEYYVRGDFRQTTQKMRGETLRAAIDQAIRAAASQGDRGKT